MKFGKRREDNKLNLIPILDAVFIFIFFLLMSAQFLDLHEIGSDVPIVQSLPSKATKDKSLHLTLEIKPNHVLVKKGLNGRLVGRITKESGSYDVDKLRKILIQLKSRHRKEKQVILKPTSKVTYKEIIQIMDTVRAFYPSSKNEEERLFNKIVFDTLGA